MLTVRVNEAQETQIQSQTLSVNKVLGGADYEEIRRRLLSLMSNDGPCRARFHSIVSKFLAYVANAITCLRMLVRVHSHSVITKAEVFFDACLKCC